MRTKLPNISFFLKLIIFVAWFSKNSRRVSESGILRPIAWVGVIKRFIRFFKIVPLGAPKFSTDSKVEESICRDGFITNSNHQFFQDPCRSEIWKHFQSYFLILFCAGFILFFFFLKVSTNSWWQKASKTSLFILCKCWHQAMFTFFKKCIHKWKHS